MDGINPYTNSIQSFVGVQSNSLEKLSSAVAINKASDDASGLAIATNLGVQKSSLAQSLDNYTSGIAMSNIAQSGISEQKSILEEIQTETLKSMNGTMSQDDKKIISDKINKLIDQYDQISSSTSYNGEKLLQTNGDATDDLSIVGDENIIDMQKADTKSISDTLKSFMSDFAVNPDSQQALLQAINSGMDQLASYASNFGSASNALESSARNAISMETNTAAAQSTILDIDYAKESADFNKTNLMSQIAMIVQTQSNAFQNRSITLLS
jgi:flagellin